VRLERLGKLKKKFSNLIGPAEKPLNYYKREVAWVSGHYSKQTGGEFPSQSAQA
jgi:hypothetical protein